MVVNTFCSWKDFIKGQEFRLKKILNPELFVWLSALEFVDVELDYTNNIYEVWYDFKISPVHRNITGFDIPKYKEIETLRTLDLLAFQEAWEGLLEIEIHTVVELFNTYDFDALYEHFLDIDREKEINQWRSQLKGKKILDIVKGQSGNVQFHIENEEGKNSVVTIAIPYTIIKKRKGI